MTWRKFAPLVIALVATLLCASCPFAVARGVAFVVVDSFDAQPIRRFSHITQKSAECQPLIAYADTAPTVVFEGGNIWVDAPLDHGVPDVVSSSSGQAVSLVGALKLPFPAAAACSVAAGDVARAGDELGAAIASAKPSNDGVAANGSNIFGPRNSDEPAIPLSSDVVSYCHGKLYNGIKFDTA